MSRLLNWLMWICFALYLAALVLFLVARFGLPESEAGPLAGVFLLILGLPWTRFVDVFPEGFWPWLVAVIPLVNVAILGGLSHAFRRG